MPPRRHSRHTFTQAFIDSFGHLILTDPEPYRFRPFRDNRTHPVSEGDTLFSLAARFFRGIPRPSGLYWIIMDFQPDPIHDPTLKLKKGSTLIIPSVRTVEEEILSESRRED